VWLSILASQLVLYSFGFSHIANKASIDIATSSSIISLSESNTSYNYLPCSHRLTDQGLPFETTQVNTNIKKKDIKNYNPFQAYIVSKLYINITYVLPVNPMAKHHWICRIQV
jgi:hypothetical protein